MIDLKPVTLDVVNNHALRLGSFCLVGNNNLKCNTSGRAIKGMGDEFPNHEFQCYTAKLDSFDHEILYLLGIKGFDQCTGNTFLINDLKENLLREDTRGKVDSFRYPKSKEGVPLDLCENNALALIAVTENHNCKPLVLVDGNHRAITHYLLKNSMEEVPIFVCEHPRIYKWKFTPHSIKRKYS